MNNRLLIILWLNFLNVNSYLLSAQVGFNAIGYNIYTNDGIQYNAVALNNTTGEIVAVGQNDDDTTLVAVYNSNGTFKSLIDIIQRHNSECLDVTFNAHNKMFIVGINNQASECFLAGFNSGYVFDFHTTLDIDNSEFHGVTIDRNGKIIAVGSANDQGLIARFNTDGALDTSFDTDGYKIEGDGAIGALIYKAAAVDSQGRIVVVGSSHVLGDDRELIVRYTSTGALDTTFNADSINGGQGYINTKLANGSIYVSVVIDDQDRIIVVGKSVIGIGLSKGIIIRYTSAGTLDTTFGDNGSGFVANGYGASENDVAVTLNQVLLDENGKIVVGGWIQSMSSGVVARHNTDGTLDTSFNGKGYTVFKITNNTVFNAISFDSQGKIIAAGKSVDSPLIARFLLNGALDAGANWNLKNYRENADVNNIFLGMLSA